MKARTLHRTTIINESREEVFKFFSTPGNLDRITPPSFAMKKTWMSTEDIRKGTLIDYKIKVNGIPLKWRTEITVWEPPYRFIDVQLKGPYRIWIHEHIFEQQGNRTVMHDHVQYLSPGWFIEPLIEKWYIRKQIDSLFDYREQRLNEIFP